MRVFGSYDDKSSTNSSSDDEVAAPNKTISQTDINNDSSTKNNVAGSSLETIENRPSSFKKCSGRKRMIHREEWLRNKEKRANNAGLSLVKPNGETKPGRAMGNGCSSLCRKKCHEIFSREKIFENFWALADKTRQWEYIALYTNLSTKKSAKQNISKLRGSNREYFLPLVDNGGVIHKKLVCYNMFLSTLGINHQWVETTYKKLIDGSSSRFAR